SLRFTALLTGILILLTPTLAFGQLTAFDGGPRTIFGAAFASTDDALLVGLPGPTASPVPPTSSTRMTG
ncbi:MAG: hypothetical protein P8X52_01620, partial [Limibacillus sp.]